MTTPLFRIARSAVFLLMAVLLTAGTAFAQVVTTTIGDFQGRPLGQTVSVPVTISDLTSPADNINSFQFTVTDIPGVANYVGYTAGPLASGWNILAFGDNITGANTNPPASQTITTNGVLLYLQFQILGEGAGNVGMTSLLYNGTPNTAVGGNFLVALREIIANEAPSPFSSGDYRVGDMVNIPVSVSGMQGPDQLAAIQFVITYNPAIVDVDLNNDGFADITSAYPGNYNFVGVVSGNTITVTGNQLNTGVWAGNGALFTIGAQAVGVGTTPLTVASLTATQANATTLLFARPPQDLTINPANTAPVATASSFSTDEDTQYSGAVSGTDAEGDPLTFAVVTNVAHGTLTFNANGTFTYMPAANYAGSDSFTFTANDSRATSAAAATVTITVDPVNDQVVAGDGNVAGVSEDDAPFDVDVKPLVSDVEDAASAMTYAAGASVGGTVVSNGDGTFTFTLTPDFNGTASFVYTVTDNGQGASPATSDSGTITIPVAPVNDAPVADDVIVETDEDTAVTFPITATDVDGDALTYSTVAPGPSHGTVTWAGNQATYMPAANYHGPDAFQVLVSDGNGGTDVADVTITVISVNDAPVANDETYSVDEGEQILVLAPGVLANDTDISSDALTAHLVTGPAHGTVLLNADGSFVYTHDGSETNADSFTYKANDGTDDSNVATVHFTINAQNDAPVAVDDHGYGVDEDGTLIVGVAAGVRANDTDAEVPTSALTVSVVTAPMYGTLTLNADGSFTYVHGGDEFATSDSFVYELSDGALTDQATAHIDITLFNDAPVVDAIADEVMTEAETLIVPVMATDAEGATLTYALSVAPATANASIDASTGVITFSPSAWDPIELGTYEFTVTVSDGIDATMVNFFVEVTRSLALCDVDMNGFCQAFDATLVLMNRVGLVDPFPQFLPFTDSQMLAGDMDTNLSVDAFDASLILRAVVSSKDETPIGDPTGVIAFGEVEQLEGMFRIPVLLSGNSSNLRSLEFILTFDPAIVSVQGLENQLSERGWLVVHNADNAAGKLHVVSAGTVDAVDGELFSIMVSAGDVSALSGMQAQAAMNAAGLAPIGSVDVTEVPESYSLSQNYPNPFNPTTTIQYQLPENAQVEVGVYDMQGRLVRMLVEKEQSAGTYTVQWDGRSSAGVQVASGIYVYQIRAGAYIATKRMTLVK